MNLKVDHARVFQRHQRCAMALYSVVLASCMMVNVTWQYLLDQDISKLQSLLQPYQTIKEENKTMETVKKNLTHLFSVPIPGISFSVLSLDETGMHVRGLAKSPEMLDKWMSHVSDLFSIEMHTSETRRRKEIQFEVVMHEKS